jgi:hypothetical protein
VALGLVACGGEEGGSGSDLGDDAQVPTDGHAGGPLTEVDEEAEEPPAEGMPAEGPAAELGDGVSASIGAAGGALSSADGRIALEIPAGALAEDTRIGIQQIENQAPGQTGKAFRLSPEGVTFAKPVTLTLQYDDADVQGSAPSLLRVAYRNSAGWHMLRDATLDTQAKTLRVESKHFSDWSLVLGAQLLPHEAVVKVGQSIQLKVSVCLQAHVEHDGDISVEYGYDCEEQPLVNAGISGWSVNGVLGGDDVTGRIRPESDGRSGRAMYDAPRQKPSQNPVAVSVQSRDPLFGFELLISHIKVLDDSSKWTGTITYEVEGSHVFPPDSGFVGDVTKKFHHKETFEIVGVRGKTGPSTYLRLTQTSDVSRSEKGTRTKQVYSSCQAGVPPILRHDTFYSVDKQLSGSLASEAIEGRVYIDEETGEYHVSMDYQSTPLAGTDTVVNTYKEGCFGGMTDDSYSKAITSSEAMPYSPKVEGVIDPEHPFELEGSYAVTFPNDILGTKGWVTWKLTRADDGM